MKKFIFVLLAALSLSSCSIDDDSSNIDYVLTPVVGNDLPESFELGKNYQVTIDYQLPSECYSFYTLDARRKGTTTPAERRTIYVGVISVIDYNNQTCDDTAEGDEGDSKFSILITEEGDYEFNFWTGEDEDGEPIYETVTVPVVDPAETSS